jgi:Arc/MetJ-type ribon-helix-helix transcriptional regulator
VIFSALARVLPTGGSLPPWPSIRSAQVISRDIVPNMKKSQTANTKKSRRARTSAKGTPISVHMPPDVLARLDQWVGSQNDRPSRPEAIRRLVELALMGPFASTAASRQRGKKAAKLAGHVLDRLTDDSATVEEQEKRKRRLIRGPQEFRDMRKDQSAAPAGATHKAKATRS